MKIRNLLIAAGALFLGCLPAFAGRPAAGPVPAAGLKEIYRWALPENDIYSAAFAASGTAVAVVTRFHWPDGHEAEDYPDDFFQALEARAKKDPRFGDPVIRLLSESGAERCQTAYGWNPDVAPDGETIVFSAQIRPVTGKRTLAEPLAGNQIRLYTCRGRTTRILAKPAGGYLDTPRFSPDRASILFTYNQAVNGDYGGAVGLGRVDLKTGRVSELIPPEKVAAFYSLVSSWSIAPGGAYFIKLIPRAEPGDAYLASSYSAELWRAGAPAQRLQTLGPLDWNQAPVLQAAAEPFLLVFAGTWKKYSPGSGALQPFGLPAFKTPAAVFSPDLKYCAVPGPGRDSGEESESLTVYAADGRQPAWMFDAHGPVRQFTWSRDSRRLAVVASRLDQLSGPGVAGRHLPHDELVVVEVP